MTLNLKKTIAAIFSLLAIVYLGTLAVATFSPDSAKVDGLEMYLPEIATVAHDTAPAIEPPANLLNYLTK